MAKKTVADKDISEIRKAIEDKKVVIGTDTSLNNLKRGSLSKVFITVNCPDNVRSDILHYAKLSKTEFVELKYSNDELGALCKKQHFISVLGIKK